MEMGVEDEDDKGDGDGEADGKGEWRRRRQRYGDREKREKGKYGTVENERYVFSCQYVDQTINLASLGQVALSFANKYIF